jgi:hypothetical protein
MAAVGQQVVDHGQGIAGRDAEVVVDVARIKRILPGRAREELAALERFEPAGGGQRGARASVAAFGVAAEGMPFHGCRSLDFGPACRFFAKLCSGILVVQFVHSGDVRRPA